MHSIKLPPHLPGMPGGVSIGAHEHGALVTVLERGGLATMLARAALAGMLGVPVVAVFGAQQAEAQIARWRPWASPATSFTSDALRDETGVAAIVAAAEAAAHG